MSTLKTNYQDAVASGNRKYRITANADGTSGIADATTYSQEGSQIGAADLNATNTAVLANAAGIVAVNGRVDTLNENLAVGGYTVNSAVVTVVNGMSAFECGNKICILSFNLLISAPAGTSALITGLPKNADSSDTAAICFLGGGVTTIKMSGTTLYLNYLNTASTGNIFGQIVYPI